MKTIIRKILFGISLVSLCMTFLGGFITALNFGAVIEGNPTGDNPVLYLKIFLINILIFLVTYLNKSVRDYWNKI